MVTLEKFITKIKRIKNIHYEKTKGRENQTIKKVRRYW